MMNAVQIKPDVYWVGGVDWNERYFHGYTTERGSTYNAYLILDEKVTLIDTTKATFSAELLSRIGQIIDPSRIDYVISNHVEQDHSGAIPRIMEIAPNATIVTSDSRGLDGLRAHYGDTYDYLPVKDGDTLNIGRRTLTFIHTTMVHWPDNMVTYDAEDKILFSNDAFGQHFSSSKHFDDEVDLAAVLEQAKKYYANIVMPYSKQVVKALEKCGGLDIDIIAPSHGIMWRSNIREILERYGLWSSTDLEDKAIVAYDSMYHSTEAMALQITEAFIACGIPVRLFDLKANHISDVMTEVLNTRYIAVGSPTLNSGMLPTVSAFLTYFKGLCPKGGRVGVPFGSYGWAPKGPQEVAAVLEVCGFDLPMGTLTHQWSQDSASLNEVYDTVVSFLRDSKEHQS